MCECSLKAEAARRTAALAGKMLCEGAKSFLQADFKSPPPPPFKWMLLAHSS